MPLWRRSDGELLTDLSPLRRMMPYVMRGRNESIVYHTTHWDVAGTRAWLREYNRARAPEQRATLFHLLVHACANMLHERPGLNRFVAGGRIYRRHGVWISFAAKTDMIDDAPLATVKLQFPPGEAFDERVRRITAAIIESRSGGERRIETEVRLLAKLPGPVLRTVMAAGRWLDRLNLLPAALIEPDPMFTSMFLANLGSIHIDNVHHHLYEYGTCSLFGVLGAVRYAAAADRTGAMKVHERLQAYWSFDERVNDGFYCVESLALLKRLMEAPDQYITRTLPPAHGVGA
jgi:hypothetical protein